MSASVETWRYLPDMLDTRHAVEQWFATALDAAAKGMQVPFAIVSRENKAVLGSTRYLEIRRRSRALEIGWSWVVADIRRAYVNTEATYLLLLHAFETLDAIRVEFKTDTRNGPALRAIQCLGAIEEGRFRRHIVCHDGHVRDTVYFSIIDQDWPKTKASIESILSKVAL